MLNPGERVSKTGTIAEEKVKTPRDDAKIASWPGLGPRCQPLHGTDWTILFLDQDPHTTEGYQRRFDVGKSLHCVVKRGAHNTMEWNGKNKSFNVPTTRMAQEPTAVACSRIS